MRERACDAAGRRYARVEVDRGECDEEARATVRPSPAESEEEFQRRSSTWVIRPRQGHARQIPGRINEVGWMRGRRLGHNISTNRSIQNEGPRTCTKSDRV